MAKAAVGKPPGASKRGSKAGSSRVAYAAAAAAAVAAVAIYYLFFSTKIGSLKLTNADALKEVFFSGNPWLIECGRSGSPVLYEAESSLPKGLRAALLDCSATLPSGKTTLERFKISPHKRGPTILMFSNVDRPVLAPMDAVRTGADLARWATRLSQPRTVAPSTPAQFDQHCTRRKWCALVLSAGSRIPPEEKSIISRLAAANRAVRFVTLDTSKMNLTAEVLEIGGGVPTPTGARSALLLLKQVGSADGDDTGAGEKRYAAKLVAEGLTGAADALNSALAGGDLPPGFVALDSKPLAELKKVPPPPPPPQSYESSSSSGTSKTLTDEELKALRAEREAERARLEEERLEQRRLQMEEEEAMAGNIVEEMEEKEGDEATGEPEEEVEEEELE
jgi:hypothetical protein